MLKKFKVKGFKNFKDEIEFDLTAGGYDFNQEAVKDGIVKNAVIYGPNGAGKSNLGRAVFDIVRTLTDKEQRVISADDYYFNLDTEERKAEFWYEFKFEDDNLKYHYVRNEFNIVVYEELYINDKIVIKFDMQSGEKIVRLSDANKLDLDKFNGDISIVRYTYRNISKSDESLVFKKFYDYVEHMLLFWSLTDRGYVGYKTAPTNISEKIIKEGKLYEFESFLKKIGLEYRLAPSEDNKHIECVFKYGKAPLKEIWSTGTNALTLYFHWYQYLKDVSLVFIDEFDAFYHWDVAIDIIKSLRDMKNLQCIITTHNTDNMDNDVLRPDCYYILKNNVMKSVNNCTDKELREVHNLQKLYRAGKFNGAFKNE